MTTRPAFSLVVRAEPGVNAIRSLRAWLKIGLRTFGLRCIHINERKETNMSKYSDKVDRQKQAGLYRVSDLQNGGGQSREVTHEIAYLDEDVEMFDRKIDVLHFTDTFKELQVNVTNAEQLIEMFGDEPARWPGNSVTLYLAEYGKEGKLGIRLKRPGTATSRPTPVNVPAPVNMDDEIPF